MGGGLPRAHRSGPSGAERSRAGQRRRELAARQPCSHKPHAVSGPIKGSAAATADSARPRSAAFSRTARPAAAPAPRQPPCPASDPRYARRPLRSLGVSPAPLPARCHLRAPPVRPPPTPSPNPRGCAHGDVAVRTPIRPRPAAMARLLSLCVPGADRSGSPRGAVPARSPPPSRSPSSAPSRSPTRRIEAPSPSPVPIPIPWPRSLPRPPPPPPCRRHLQFHKPGAFLGRLPGKLPPPIQPHAPSRCRDVGRVGSTGSPPGGAPLPAGVFGPPRCLWGGWEGTSG